MKSYCVSVQPLATDTTIRQDKSGSFHLQAADAEIVGSTAQLEGENIGYWTTTSDYVQWKLNVAHPGTFEVSLDYACEPGSAGSEYQMIAGDQKLDGKINSTGSWRHFRTVKVGQIRIDHAGEVTVQVKPLSKPGLGVMNLRTLILKEAR